MAPSCNRTCLIYPIVWQLSLHWYVYGIIVPVCPEVVWINFHNTQWLTMPSNLIFLGLHFAISKCELASLTAIWCSDVHCLTVYSNTFLATYALLILPSIRNSKISIPVWTLVRFSDLVHMPLGIKMLQSCGLSPSVPFGANSPRLVLCHQLPLYRD